MPQSGALYSSPGGVREGGGEEGQSPALNHMPMSPRTPSLPQGSCLTLPSGNYSRWRNLALASLPELHCLFHADLEFFVPFAAQLAGGGFSGPPASRARRPLPRCNLWFEQAGLAVRNKRNRSGDRFRTLSGIGEEVHDRQPHRARVFDPPPNHGQLTSPHC